MEAAVNLSDQTGLFTHGDNLEVITFYISATQYATPVSEVRYIEQDKRKTTRIEVNEKLGAEVTSYQGKPVAIYDLANLMGCEAEYTSNISLMKTLKARENDHINWLNALESSIKTKSPFTLAKDPHQCAFGQWYSSFKADDEILADIMLDFDKPHQKLHELADELLAMAETDGTEAALVAFEYEKGRTFSKLSALFSAARERLENITRPILLYIDTGHKMIAVRLNAISDIVTYHRADFTLQSDVDDNKQLNELSFVAGYLENKSDEPPCVLLDWKKFKTPTA